MEPRQLPGWRNVANPTNLGAYAYAYCRQRTWSLAVLMLAREHKGRQLVPQGVSGIHEAVASDFLPQTEKSNCTA